MAIKQISAGYSSNNNSVHFFGAIGNYSTSGFRIDVYSNNPSYIKKLAFIIMVKLNYYNFLNNFRFMMCVFNFNGVAAVVDSNNQAGPGICPINPPLSSTSAKFVAAFHGVDLTLANSWNTIGVIVNSTSTVIQSVAQLNVFFASIWDQLATKIWVGYVSFVFYDDTAPYYSNFNIYTNLMTLDVAYTVNYTVDPDTYWPMVPLRTFNSPLF